jgi:hypothetical protein
MTAVLGTTAGAVSNATMNWHDIEWEKVHQNVRRLQARIVKATQKILWRWARRRHPNKSAHWVKDKYFRSHKGLLSPIKSYRAKSHKVVPV